MKKNLFFALAALALVSMPSASFADKYKFDPLHTQIIFSVSHLGFSFSHGRFMKFDGEFTFDPAMAEASTATVTIDTTGLEMNDKTWNEHMSGENFFNVAKFPTITFNTTKVEKTGDATGKMTGDLTLLGVTKPVTLDVTYNKSGVHPYSQNHVAGFSAHGTLKRSDFGMGYGLPDVGDEVSIEIQVEGVQQEQAKTNP